MPKKAIFRVDSSRQIGAGHLMRCLNLAKTLRRENIHIIFICKALSGHFIPFILKQDFEVYILPVSECHKNLTDVNLQDELQQMQVFLNQASPFDYCIVDHYGLDKRWQKAHRPFIDKMIVIDDLANSEHDCDLLINQNVEQAYATQYQTHLPQNCRLLLGPQYALLDDSFSFYRNTLGSHSGVVKRILICFGGSDVHHETQFAIQACLQLQKNDFAIDVIVANDESLRQFYKEKAHIHFHSRVDNIAELMTQADLAIGAGGVMTWERCCLGLPSVVVTVAENQINIAKAMDAYGALIYGGHAGSLTSNDLTNKIAALIHDPIKLNEMSQRGKALVDGHGCARVVKHML